MESKVTPTPSDDHDASTWTRIAWFAVALLLPVALLNYMDRQMIASMKSSIMSDISSIDSDAAWGRILAQFKWVYAFLSPIGGYVADRFSRRLTICSSLFVWSAITVYTGRVTSYDELLWTRTLMGISEAFYMPAALALIANMHPPKTRSTAVGIHQAAILIGVMVGGTSGYVADSPVMGWRFAFIAAGLIGIFYAGPLFYFLPDRTQLEVGLKKSRVTFKRIARELLSNPSYLLLLICFTLPAMSGWIVRDWMPAILKTKFGTSQGLAGVSATHTFSLGALCAAFVGGYLADRWTRRTRYGRILVSALGMMLLIPGLFGVEYAPTIGIAAISLVIYGIGWGFFDVNNMPILSQIARPDLRATGYGLMNFVSIMLGGVADRKFGELRDQNVSLHSILIGLSCVILISIFCVLMIRPRIEDTAN